MNTKPPVDEQIRNVFLPFYWYLKAFGFWPSQYRVKIHFLFIYKHFQSQVLIY